MYEQEPAIVDKSTVIRVSRHFTVCKCFLPAGRKDVQIKKGQLSGILLKTKYQTKYRGSGGRKLPIKAHLL